MKIAYLSSHAVLEYDQVKLWTDMGYDVFSIGAYTDPADPAVALRPSIAAPYYADLAAACHEQRVRHLDEWAGYPIIDWAKADLPQAVIDWADAIIVDCYPESWIKFNWRRIADKRVIWRTIGQSGPETEAAMGKLDGLQIVRYSPAEARAYGKHDWFAGEDAVIRFGKDPADWYGWTGERAVIGNLAQHDQVPHGRGQFLHWDWLEQATAGLPFEFGGPNSELIGGLGALDYDAMRAYLRSIRAYAYSGTVPASYTLGMIEALMTGVPVISISKGDFGIGELFEGDEIAPFLAANASAAHAWLETTLARPVDEAWDTGATPLDESRRIREQAIEMFGVEKIGKQWAAFLGAPVREMVAA